MNTFLAANTCSGFYSLFSQMTEKTDHNILLIKGGPGTGKSSLMKRFAERAQSKGMTVEKMHCSSDPSSLDGIWVKEKKLILLDATAPHCADPRYPGAVEQILPLGEFWDRDKLISHRKQIISLTTQISSVFKRIYTLLSAAGSLRRTTEQLIRPCFDQNKADKMITKFLSLQGAVHTGKKARVQQRFISALSNSGYLLYEDALSECKNVLLLEDNYDCAHLFTALVDQKLEQLGYDRLQLLCPLEPDKIDHIIVKDLSLAIISQNFRSLWQSDLPIIKTVQMRQLTDTKALSAHKSKLTFYKKLCKSLYDEVFGLLASEKTLHDKLEQYYILAMDFEGLERQTQHLIDKLI